MSYINHIARSLWDIKVRNKIYLIYVFIVCSAMNFYVQRY